MPVDQVKKKFLNMPSSMKSFEQLFNHPNWKALDKYEQMVWQKENEGKTVAYALIGTKYYSKEKTQEELLKWLVQKKSVKTVGNGLGVGGLARNDPIARQNWRAFAMYEKSFAEVQNVKTNPEKYSRFGSGYHTEKKTKEALTKWAMLGTPIKEVLKTFKLTGLSASGMAKHENFPALLISSWLYHKDNKPNGRDAHVMLRLGNTTDSS
ncbi:hypothetical protein PI124_g6431 [Phytophthora idaei]|nr:hypothetical protein PI125_g14973 [Phytophthora idaei]KAG3163989.1 hypothetical protein PI126_g5289 [Phytophthora idaei]KAG3248926.1 hypothetical protein PI124_g6431 [Phytophthora idaei]